MDIRQLRYFMTIVDEGSVTAAAVKLNMSQPPLSAQLKLLEDELGIELFERKNRKLILKEDGKLLYDRAKSLIHDYDQTLQYFSDLKDGVIGTLSIGCIASLSILFFPSIIKDFLSQYPNLDLQMRENNTSGLLYYLDQRMIELCLIKSDFDKSNYNCLCIDDLVENWEDCLAVVGLSEMFDNASLNEYDFQDLAGKPLIVQKFYENTIRSIASELSFEPKIISSLENVMTSLNWCLYGLGISIMPYSATKLASLLTHGDRLVIKKLRKPTYSINTYLVWNKRQTLSAPAQKFIDYIRSKT